MLKLTKEEKEQLKASIANIETVLKGHVDDTKGVNTKSLMKVLAVVDVFQKEMANLEKIASMFAASPGEVPKLPGVDIYGRVMPLYGIGGDHITYVDFNQRFDMDWRIEFAKSRGLDDVAAKLEITKTRAGVLIADAEGHMNTDSFISKLFHQCFLLGAQYELEKHGEITHRLLRNINQRFFESTSVLKTITALYCEVQNDGLVRFISAAHPEPYVFSNEWDKFVRAKNGNGEAFEASSPIGWKSSGHHLESNKYKGHPMGYKEPYRVNEFRLGGPGDIVLLFTDGLQDHRSNDGIEYLDSLEKKLVGWKSYSAQKITDIIAHDVMQFNPEPQDDISVVVIKKL